MYLSQFELNGKVGFKNDCKIILPPIYETASYFRDDYAVVKYEGAYGLINKTGDFIIPNKYDELAHLFGDYYRARINCGDSWKCGVIDIYNHWIINPTFKAITHKDNLFFLCYKQATFKEEDSKYFSLHGRYNYTGFEGCSWYNLNGEKITDLPVESCCPSFLIFSDENGAQGIMDSKGIITLEPKFDKIKICLENVFLAEKKREEKCLSYVIDSKGNTILESQNDNYCFENGFFYTGISDKKKWYSYLGILVFEGNAKPLSKDYITIFKNGKWGVLDPKKNRVINFIYNEIALLSDCFVVLREDKLGLIGLRGEVIIDTIYKSIECVTIENNFLSLGCKEVLARNTILDGTKYLGYCKEYTFDTNGHTNYQGAKCDWLIRNVLKAPKKYNSNSYHISYSKQFDLTKPLILSTDQYQELYLHEDGVIPNSRYEEIEQITELCYVVKQGQHFGVFRIDSHSLIIPIEFQQIIFKGGHTVLISKNELWGARDLLLESNKFKSLLKVDIECKYFDLDILTDYQTLFGAKCEYINYKNESKPYFTILDSKGEETGDFQSLRLDSQFTRFDDRLFLSSKKGKIGFVSKSGYISVPFIYDEITPRKGGNFNIRIGNGWGIMNINGLEIVNPKYSMQLPLYIAKPENFKLEYDDLKNDTAQSVETNERGLTMISDSRSGCFGCIDNDGHEIIPSVYEHLMFSKDRYIYFGYGGYEGDKSSTFFSHILYAKWGCLDGNGKVIIEPKYDCFKLQNGFILAGRDGSFLGDEDNNDYEYYNEYSGVYDLYAEDGTLIIGGFREMYYDEDNDVFAFFYGGDWERYCSYEDDWNDLYFYSYKFEYKNDLWLVVNSQLNTIQRNDKGEAYKFKKGFIGKIEIKKDEEKITHVYNMPINLMAKGFCRFGINCAFVKPSNSSDKVAALDFETGIQTPFYDSMMQISNHLFFYAEESKCGIRSINEIILSPEYTMFTHPINGYFFAMKESDDSNSTIELFHMSDISKPICTAISCKKTSILIDEIGYGRLKLEHSGGANLSNLKIPKHRIFDDAFIESINLVETQYFCSAWKDKYYFASDYRFMDADSDDYDYSDYEGHDYMRDTWDAMTDGMYGDMPDGFDGDFSFLGY